MLFQLLRKNPTITHRHNRQSDKQCHRNRARKHNARFRHTQQRRRQHCHKHTRKNKNRRQSDIKHARHCISRQNRRGKETNHKQQNQQQIMPLPKTRQHQCKPQHKQNQHQRIDQRTIPIQRVIRALQRAEQDRKCALCIFNHRRERILRDHSADTGRNPFDVRVLPPAHRFRHNRIREQHRRNHQRDIQKPTIPFFPIQHTAKREIQQQRGRHDKKCVVRQNAEIHYKTAQQKIKPSLFVNPAQQQPHRQQHRQFRKRLHDCLTTRIDIIVRGRHKQCRNQRHERIEHVARNKIKYQRRQHAQQRRHHARRIKIYAENIKRDFIHIKRYGCVFLLSGKITHFLFGDKIVIHLRRPL